MNKFTYRQHCCEYLYKGPYSLLHAVNCRWKLALENSAKWPVKNLLGGDGSCRKLLQDWHDFAMTTMTIEMPLKRPATIRPSATMQDEAWQNMLPSILRLFLCWLCLIIQTTRLGVRYWSNCNAYDVRHRPGASPHKFQKASQAGREARYSRLSIFVILLSRAKLFTKRLFNENEIRHEGTDSISHVRYKCIVPGAVNFGASLLWSKTCPKHWQYFSDRNCVQRGEVPPRTARWHCFQQLLCQSKVVMGVQGLKGFR